MHLPTVRRKTILETTALQKQEQWYDRHFFGPLREHDQLLANYCRDTIARSKEALVVSEALALTYTTIKLECAALKITIPPTTNDVHSALMREVLGDLGWEGAMAKRIQVKQPEMFRVFASWSQMSRAHGETWLAIASMYRLCELLPDPQPL